MWLTVFGGFSPWSASIKGETAWWMASQRTATRLMEAEEQKEKEGTREEIRPWRITALVIGLFPPGHTHLRLIH